MVTDWSRDRLPHDIRDTEAEGHQSPIPGGQLESTNRECPERSCGHQVPSFRESLIAVEEAPETNPACPRLGCDGDDWLIGQRAAAHRRQEVEPPVDATTKCMINFIVRDGCEEADDADG